MVERTKRYLDSLKDENETLMIPTPVVAEYLQGFDRDAQPDQLDKLQRYFFLPSFDVASACLAAEISSGKTVPTSYGPGDRDSIKTDVQIIAIAIVHRADLIVTHNVSEFSRLAGDRIQISDVPSVPQQPQLF